ncbi:MAG: type II secretion system F family protein [Planctomycetes bacterium]|nr:type II secretion system F family protein [Planctomycetota bacterium]
MTPILISLLVFVAVAGVVGLVAFVLADTPSRTADRLDLLTGRRRKEDDEAASILKKSAFENDKRSLLHLLTPNIPSLQKILMQADCHISASTLFGIGLVLGVLGATGSWLAGVPSYLTPLAGLVMFVVPFGWLLNKRRMRLKAFAAQLSDALELVARALRAGHSLAAGMHVVAEEMPSPIADEFGRVYEEQNLGIPIEDALRSVCDRVPNLDLRFFVTSVLIQRQTGGDLSEILDKIGYVVRERFRILGQVKALTAEGRLSGIILIALPFGLFLIMLHIKPDYVEKLWTHPTGVKMGVFALIAQLVGALVIKKIVNIKV